MHVNHIVVRDIENRWESLPLALQAVARWAGVELHFRSINAALGLSFAISSPENHGIAPAAWMSYGREAFLLETCKLFGLQLEALPRADRHITAPDSPEDTAFFHDTIRPRLNEALSDNHPVLCWRGWPDYHSLLWGIINDFDDGPLGFRGTTMWAHGGQLPLASPPHKLYVVTDAHPRQPGGDELLRFAMGNIASLVHNRVDPALGVVFGLAAYDRWIEWLESEPLASEGPGGGHNDHYQLARSITHNRESAVRFIDHYKDGLHDDIRSYLEAMHADCKGTIGALSTSRDLKAVEVLFRSEDGREALIAGVRAAKDFLTAQIKTIDHLVDALGVA